MSRGELKILTPTGMLGYGFPIKWFQEGVARNPDVIAVDSGSTDSGPQKLGLGDMTCSREAYYKDISLLLEACHGKKIPLYISSAGGDGSNEHVDTLIDIIKEISQKKGYQFKIAAIYSEIDRDFIKQKMKDHKVRPCGPVEELTEEEVDEATAIVAQMGVEPYLKAIEDGEPDIIVSGRAYDPVPIAALGIKRGFDPGLCWHMGKIMECGALCAEPSAKSIIGILKEDHFILEPLDPSSKCSVTSVAAHTLYEKTHPYLLPGPGGVLDLSDTKFEQLDDRRVKVSNSKFIPDEIYTIKLEGAKKLGFRTICIAGVRDPIQIQQLDWIMDTTVKDVQEYFNEIPKDSYEMIFHVYGRDGVMGEFEREKNVDPTEICLILEVAAPTQEMATAICSRARTEILHSRYEGRIATAGNIALPFTPLEIPLGRVCKFNVYHIVEIEDPTELFPIKFLEV